MRRFGLLITDLVLVAAATVLALVLRENFELPIDHLVEISPYIGFTVLMAAVALPLVGASQSVWRFSSMNDYLRLGTATLITVVGAVMLGFSQNRLEGVARSLPILQSMLIMFMLVGVRVAMRLRYNARGAQVTDGVTPSAIISPATETVLVVGMTRLTELYVRSIAEFAPSRIRVAGLLGRHERHTGRVVMQHKVLGTPEQAAEALRELEVHGVKVDTIVIATAFDKLSSKAQRILPDIEKSTDIKLLMLPDSLGLSSPKPQVSSTDERSGDSTTERDQPGFSLDNTHPSIATRQSFWQLKRVFDLTASLVMLVVLAPVIAAVAVLVAIDVGLPVTFWQQRPGLGGGIPLTCTNSARWQPLTTPLAGALMMMTASPSSVGF